MTTTQITTQQSMANWWCLANKVLSIWPEHKGFLDKATKSLSDDESRAIDDLAELITRIASGHLDSLAEDYRWTCEQLVEEELHFRRTGSYRRTKFQDVLDEVYNNSGFMGRYINGLLMSQALWANHARAFYLYVTAFLPKNIADYDHLEIGPGHGLWLYQTINDKSCKSVSGWDVSQTSIAKTAAILDFLGVRRKAELSLHDIQVDSTTSTPSFDSVVISEVLEHLESPRTALSRIFDVMRPKGRLFVNMPINSPAPDHIYLLQNPADVWNLIDAAGFRITEKHCCPATGYSLEKAERLSATISCIVIAEKPE